MSRGLWTGLILVFAVVAAASLYVWKSPALDADPALHARATAQTQLRMIADAAEAFKKDKGRYPTSSEGLAALQGSDAGGPYLSNKHFNVDPWGSPYVYRVQPSGLHLYSIGPNKTDENGSVDDVIYRKSD